MVDDFYVQNSATRSAITYFSWPKILNHRIIPDEGRVFSFAILRP